MSEHATIDANEAEVVLPAVPEPKSRTGKEIMALKSGGAISAVVPQTLEDAFRLAQAVVMAGLAPASYEGPSGQPDAQKVVIGILKSMEVGLPPITGLNTICIINKRPCIWGDGAVALIQARGVVEKSEQTYTGEEDADDYTAHFCIWRRGQENPYEGHFSVKDAKRAGLWQNHKKQPWMLYPKRMLMMRARAFALRDGFADCLSGLSIAEEIQDIAPEPKAVDTDFLDNAPAPAQITEEKPTSEAAE